MYYLADANFNVTALVSTSGTVVERYLYTPYGEVTVLDSDFSGDADGDSDYDNTTLYTGRTFDSAIGLYDYRHRVYHPQLGRFVSRDPVGYEDGMNVYCYVHDSPTIALDPFGLDETRSVTGNATFEHRGYGRTGGVHYMDYSWKLEYTVDDEGCLKSSDSAELTYSNARYSMDSGSFAVGIGISWIDKVLLKTTTTPTKEVTDADGNCHAETKFKITARWVQTRTLCLGFGMGRGGGSVPTPISWDVLMDFPDTFIRVIKTSCCCDE